MLTKGGWLKKQGGSKGGNKASWKKRWFVIESETDRILYYVDSKSKEFKGAIELVRLYARSSTNLSGDMQRNRRCNLQI